MGETRIGTCTFCGYVGIPVKEFEFGPVGESSDRRKVDLCSICAHNIATGQACAHPGNYTVHEVDMLKLVAWIGNHIVEEIKKER